MAQLAGAGPDASAGETAAAGAPAGTCNSGKGAVITGRVLSPSGELPLAGVTVYVPSERVDPLPKGGGCFRCELSFSGEPGALAVTRADGSFEIENAPVGAKVPLVVQTGKWRRQLELEVVACRDNAVAETETRLPRRQSEGNLPAIALVSGGEDTLECLLRKLGVDDSEFSFEAGKPRVRLFRGKGGIAALDGVSGSALAPSSQLLNADTLGTFDLVLLGSETDQNSAEKPGAALTALHDYVAGGGRVLVQHFQNYFLSAGPSDLSSLATYDAKPDPPAPLEIVVDESSARGKALADSLLAAAPQAPRGQLSSSRPRRSVQDLQSPAVRLLYSDAPASVQAFSVDLPSDGEACGRLTETEILTGSPDTIANFPSGCTSRALTSEERALGYLIFDLGSCLP
jgi:hypothetical protein